MLNLLTETKRRNKHEAARIQEIIRHKIQSFFSSKLFPIGLLRFSLFFFFWLTQDEKKKRREQNRRIREKLEDSLYQGRQTEETGEKKRTSFESKRSNTHAKGKKSKKSWNGQNWMFTIHLNVVPFFLYRNTSSPRFFLLLLLLDQKINTINIFASQYTQKKTLMLTRHRYFEQKTDLCVSFSYIWNNINNNKKKQRKSNS